MGDILALGLTHYPPLSGRDEQMAGLLRRMLTMPRLPEHLKDPKSWPEEMRQQWANDEGLAAAARHRADLVGWMDRSREALDAFKPDFVLMWGDDQYENFREDIIPPFAISAHEEFNFSPPADNVWGEDPTKKIRIAGAPKIAKELTTSLIEEGFDVAYSYKPLHHPLGHAFYNAVNYLDYGREKGFPYPLIPFAINCYGRRVIAQRGGSPNFDHELSDDELDPPAPTPKRLFDLGAATARILKKSPYRVALIASSGWSHAFLTMKNHYLYPDVPADRKMYEALVKGDWDTWRNLTGKEVEDAGQQEILNWSCLVGAMSELNQPPVEHGFVGTWIFNSSKVFAIAPPKTGDGASAAQKDLATA
ncbi:MAG: hypothetical protein Q8M88_16745 [Phenylobacterium sp.]|uniref:DODA-type extradiol aromatic ring-opening family dioxygenase n=1 Tax=Phenylobacterium sp. TaxID=1871053 RepID=UPI0027328CC5|nr:hypothetical protein [Phenylobacterium sp.]MDP3176079.1 hypothetical protein [Phenylobacterium sp.]